MTLDARSFREFLRWRETAIFWGHKHLWEAARLAESRQPLTVEMVDWPWGQEPQISPFGNERALCAEPVRNEKRWGMPCRMLAGNMTSHIGAGACRYHGGNRPKEVTRGFMIMAHAYARHFAITPAEALQQEVERTVGAVQWLDEKIGTATKDDDLLPDGDLGPYVDLRFRERTHLLRASQAAISGGVTQLLAQQMRTDGEAIAAVMTRAVGALGLPPEQEDRLRLVISEELRDLAVSRREALPAMIVPNQASGS